MTSDDGATDLLSPPPEELGAPPRRLVDRHRAGRLIGAALMAVALVTGVGIAAVLYSRPSTSAAPDGPATGPATAASSSPTAASPTAAAPTEGADLVEADLTGPGVGHSAGRLIVGTGVLRTGLVPPVPNFAVCTDAPTQVEYLPVEIRLPTSGLAGRVTVERGPATPPDAGRLGFFFESGTGNSVPCVQGKPWPASDTFEAVNGARVIRGYVTLGGAVTPAAPQGRPDVVRTLQVRVSDLRFFDDYEVAHPLAVGAPSLGALCPGSRTSVCVPLG